MQAGFTDLGAAVTHNFTAGQRLMNDVAAELRRHGQTFAGEDLTPLAQQLEAGATQMESVAAQAEAELGAPSDGKAPAPQDAAGAGATSPVPVTPPVTSSGAGAATPLATPLTNGAATDALPDPSLSAPM